jgi:hypothetical protein
MWRGMKVRSVRFPDPHGPLNYSQRLPDQIAQKFLGICCSSGGDGIKQ